MHNKKQHEPIWQEIAKTLSLNERPVVLFESIDSTNTRAMALAKAGNTSGTVIIAQTQNNGRGRIGKTWESPKGTGLYFSLIIRPQLAPEDLAKITLTTGLALRNGVAKISGISAQLKWPNDLLFKQKKLAGILTETVLSINDRPTVIIGIGLNVNTPAPAFPQELRAKATSMRIITDCHFDKGAVLAAILNEIEREIERLANNDFAGILSDWREQDATYGKWLTWLTPAGQKITGLSLGPDEEGRLHIRDKEGKKHRILSGNLEIAPQL